MFRVMVVDDEPYALQHICSIVQEQCPHFQVVATAENGEEALAQMEQAMPDVLISDVKMPRMNGIELVSRVRAACPDMVAIIVSGYQDFEYAKGALQSGVCDYLLKPLKPSDLRELLDRTLQRLTTLHHSRRTEMMRAMCNSAPLGACETVARYFPSAAYYAAIIRKNGLPKRFSRQTGIELFSTEDETVLVYGRDEMEALYLFPQELLAGQCFCSVVEPLYESEKSEYYYVTAVLHPDAFTMTDFCGIVKKLYRKLDESLIIGKNQLVLDCVDMPQPEITAREKEQKEHVEYLIKYKESGKLLDEFDLLLDLWEQSEHSQIFVEMQLRSLLQHLSKKNEFTHDYGAYTFLLDDAFFYVSTFQELKIEMKELLIRLDPSLGVAQTDDKTLLFHSILAYLESHLEQPLTLNNICQRFFISQTLLSKLFRTYKKTSFSNYLTETRIEKAKQILKQNPNAFIKIVAERVGYKDQFYFSRIFRSVVGVCPREYVGQLEAPQ